MTYESPDLAGMLERMIRALVRRAGEGDLDAIVALRDTRRHVDEGIVLAARGAHRFGYSWTEIARELDVTRQAARQRFADDPRPVSPADLINALGGRPGPAAAAS